MVPVKKLGATVTFNVVRPFGDDSLIVPVEAGCVHVTRMFTVPGPGRFPLVPPVDNVPPPPVRK